MRTREEIETRMARYNTYFSPCDQAEAFCLALELLLDIRDLLTTKPDPTLPTPNAPFGRRKL